MELTSLQKNIIKVMQDKDNFDENGKPKNRKGMQQCHFLHLLEHGDKDIPLLVEAMEGLESMGLVSIGRKLPSKGRDDLGKTLTVAEIFLSTAGIVFKVDSE